MKPVKTLNLIIKILIIFAFNCTFADNYNKKGNNEKLNEDSRFTIVDFKKILENYPNNHSLNASIHNQDQKNANYAQDILEKSSRRAILRTTYYIKHYINNQTAKKAQDSNDINPAHGLITMGNQNAKVVVEEYMSPSCFGCKLHYQDYFHKIKAKFIDTGLIKYVAIECIHNKLDACAATLARCALKNKGIESYLRLKNDFFNKQSSWVATKKYKEILLSLAQKEGINEEEYEECVSDAQIDNALLFININKARAAKIKATPTILINGKELQDMDSVMEEIEKALKDLEAL